MFIILISEWQLAYCKKGKKRIKLDYWIRRWLWIRFNRKNRKSRKSWINNCNIIGKNRKTNKWRLTKLETYLQANFRFSSWKRGIIKVSIRSWSCWCIDPNSFLCSSWKGWIGSSSSPSCLYFIKWWNYK